MAIRPPDQEGDRFDLAPGFQAIDSGYKLGRSGLLSPLVERDPIASRAPLQEAA